MSPAEVEDLVTRVSSLASAMNLRERAIDGYKKWITNSHSDGQDCLDGWAEEEIELQFTSCSLVFAHDLLDYPFIDTRLQLNVRDLNGLNSLPIGYYRLITLLDGTDDDDYFVIDSPKPNSR